MMIISLKTVSSMTSSKFLRQRLRCRSSQVSYGWRLQMEIIRVEGVKDPFPDLPQNICSHSIDWAYLVFQIIKSGFLLSIILAERKDILWPAASLVAMAFTKMETLFSRRVQILELKILTSSFIHSSPIYSHQVQLLAFSDLLMHSNFRKERSQIAPDQSL